MTIDLTLSAFSAGEQSAITLAATNDNVFRVARGDPARLIGTEELVVDAFTEMMEDLIAAQVIAVTSQDEEARLLAAFRGGDATLRAVILLEAEGA